MIYYYNNIKNEYEKISVETYTDNVDFGDDEIIKENNKEVVVINKKHKQSIIFHEYRFEDEEYLDDTCKIPNYISTSAYNYICNVLNNNDNITVFWSQVYQTTSDYTIIYGKYITDGEECRKYLEEHNTLSYYKYLDILEDGTCRKCPEGEYIL